MKALILIPFFLSMFKPTYEYHIADLDKDGRMDTLYYDANDSSIIYLLSGRDFLPSRKKYELEAGNIIRLDAREGGFCIHDLHMRSFTTTCYEYEEERKQFRLSELSYEDNRGETVYSLNLLKGEYEATLSSYDIENDTLITYPPINMWVQNDPVYLGDLSTLHLPDYNFFEEYKKNYHPPYSDTLTYIGFDGTYDYQELIGEKNGELYYMQGGSYNGHRGDLIEIDLFTFCYQEVADGDIFYARTFVGNIHTLREGALSQFYKTNKKQIHYSGDQPDNWRYEESFRPDIDYYLANTKDATIKHALMEPGTLEIETFSYAEKESDYFFRVLIAQVNGGKRKPVGEFFLKLFPTYQTEYYIFDQEKGDFSRVDM
ncbi:MAG: hypothetical protein LUH22_03750 [Bacteroides sp.]|nr:hypothetical protein [Bacteroides sp.]